MTRMRSFVYGIVSVASMLVALTFFSYDGKEFRAEKNPNHIVLSKSNLLVLDSDIDQASVAEVMNNARKLRDCPIYLFMNTSGGSIPAGLEMIDMLKGLSCPVKTITRFAASMGFHTVQNLDERLALPNATFMSHHARGTFSGEYGGNRPAQIDKRLKLSVSQWAEMDAIVVARTKGKQTMKSYLNSYETEMWITAKQAIEGGYADRIVTAECDHSLDGGVPMTVQYQSSMVTFEKSNCPLISGPIRVDVKPPAGVTMTYEDFISKKDAFVRQFNKDR